MLFLISLFLQTSNLLVLDIDQVFALHNLDSFAQILREPCILVILLAYALLQILEIVVEQGRHEVMIHIVQGFGPPACGL